MNIPATIEQQTTVPAQQSSPPALGREPSSGFVTFMYELAQRVVLGDWCLPNARQPVVRANIKGYTDRRSRWLANAGRHLEDRAIERKWREKVAAHPVERRRLGMDRPFERESISAFLRRQAD